MFRFCGTLTNVFSVATSQHPLVTCSVPFNLHFHSAMSGYYVILGSYFHFYDFKESSLCNKLKCSNLYIYSI